MKKTNNIFKHVLFAILIILLIASFVYKWLEWNSLKDLASLYSSSVTGELKILSDLEEKRIDWSNKTKDFFASSTGSAELQKKAYSNLESSNDLMTNSFEEFNSLEKTNKQKYIILKDRLKMFFGQNINTANKIIQNQLDFYDVEIASGSDGRIMYSFYKNMAMIYYDLYQIFNFNKVAINTQTAKNNFGMLSPIAKYDEGSFKYDNEDAIRGYAPEEYKILTKEKRYFSSFYELVKLTVKDQENSQNAINLRNKLNQDIANINIDFPNLFSDKKEVSLKRYKQVMTLVNDQLLEIYNVNNNNLFSYPLLGVVKFQKHDLWHCQFYEYKSGYYNFFNKKYPDSKNPKELISDLSSLSPKTDLLDKKFDLKGLAITNSKDAFNITCTDKDNDEKYDFKEQK